MSITVLPYHNQAFVDQVNAAAQERARALEAERQPARPQISPPR